MELKLLKPRLAINKAFLKVTADKDVNESVVNFSEQILSSKRENQDTTSLESEIDELVYQLYGLTEEEIKIVEGEK